MRWPKRFSCPGTTRALTGILVGLHFVSAAGPAGASSTEPFTFENADIQTVVAQVARLTGIPFVFDPKRVTGKITLLSPKSVSPTEALELLKSALAMHGYALVRRAEATWIVPAQPAAAEGFTIRVLPLTYAHAGELAYTLSRIAPPSIRIVPHYPTNSLIISGHPAAVEELIGTVK
jgi:general secretion pathway protein D